MKINKSNYFRFLIKLRKQVFADINNNNQSKGFEDIFCEFQDWLNEIDREIARSRKKKIKIPIH